jgi:excisionase family DNA binding protein
VRRAIEAERLRDISIGAQLSLDANVASTPDRAAAKRARRRADVSGAIHVVTECQGFFTPKTLAAYLALSERTVRQLLADSAIPSYRIAGSRRIDPRDVDNYLRTCRNVSALTSQIEPARRGPLGPAPAPKEY